MAESKQEGKANRNKENAVVRIGNIRDRFINAREKISNTGERISQIAEKSRETIKKHPVKSVIIAAAVGAAIGITAAMLIKKSREKEKETFLAKIKSLF